MSLLLKKEHITDEGDEIWMVTCYYNSGNEELIPFEYCFDYIKTEAQMEAIIVPDLTDKGYDNLSPVVWEEIT